MTAPTPHKLTYNCPTQCSLRPEAIGSGPAAALLVLKENGSSIRGWMKQAQTMLPDRELNATTVARHFKHFREVDPGEPEIEEKAEPTGKVTDLEILDRIITAGARNARNWKPTIGDTLKAMEMKLRLTGNSAFEDMLDAMALAATEEDDEEPDVEAPEALGDEDEREEEPLAEPAY